ncbi:hypothetical protein K440DRAFT_312891 [Wilcoxina mikolae CBS 423.85]|nr:hypothetical protein K440DRAFT_312891 [Wilcoxina mikolae CBS 423.85]
MVLFENHQKSLPLYNNYRGDNLQPTQWQWSTQLGLGGVVEHDQRGDEVTDYNGYFPHDDSISGRTPAAPPPPPPLLPLLLLDICEEQAAMHVLGPHRMPGFDCAFLPLGYNGLAPHNGYLPTASQGVLAQPSTGTGYTDQTMQRPPWDLLNGYAASAYAPVPDLTRSPASLKDSIPSPKTPMFQSLVPEGSPLMNAEGIAHASTEELPRWPRSLEGMPPKMNKPYPNLPEVLPWSMPATLGHSTAIELTSHGPENILADESIQALPIGSTPLIKCQGASPDPVPVANRKRPHNARTRKTLDERRKRPRGYRHSEGQEQPERGKTPPKFQCTFLCGQRFDRAHNWKRHEREVHMVLEEWACKYCDDEPPQVHSRKGHLLQHLLAVHEQNEWLDEYNDWKEPIQPPTTSRCGFCPDTTFEDWGSRNEHICEHFAKGAELENWKGDLGLTEEWMRRARVPPSKRSRPTRSRT